MGSIRYAFLSLLAREPLSGYDIKLYMNDRLNPFWKAGSNQVYPELSKMEKEGLIKLQGIEQHAYRPARKVYEITEAGREAIIQWTIESGGVNNLRDDFILKIYNSWLTDPEEMKLQIEDMKKQREEKLAEYMMELTRLSELLDVSDNPASISSTILIMEFGIQYERLYIEWCNNLINKI